MTVFQEKIKEVLANNNHRVSNIKAIYSVDDTADEDIEIIDLPLNEMIAEEEEFTNLTNISDEDLKWVYTQFGLLDEMEGIDSVHYRAPHEY